VKFPQEINNSDKIPRHPDRRETDSIPIVIDGTLVVPIVAQRPSSQPFRDRFPSTTSSQTFREPS
jgi:hypothetical protein